MTPIEIIIVLIYYNDSNLPPEDSLQIKGKNLALKASFIRRLHCSSKASSYMYMHACVYPSVVPSPYSQVSAHNIKAGIESHQSIIHHVQWYLISL